MKIVSAEMSGNFLMLRPEHDSIGEARRFVYGFKPGNYVIRKMAVKRSLNANALMWHLCQEIGSAIGESAMFVYRRAIKEGNSFYYVAIPDESVERFVGDWVNNGDGWIVQVLDSDEGKTHILAYYGTSRYNTKEMSELIDRLLQDADALGIDCLDERERSLLRDIDEAIAADERRA